MDDRLFETEDGMSRGRGEGEDRAFRVIKFSSDRPRHSSVKVEEYEV